MILSLPIVSTLVFVFFFWFLKEVSIYSDTTHLMQLFPDCAPHSVAYLIELLALRHCAGCEFYRAEGRGESWDSEGNHIEKVRLDKFLHPGKS